MQFTKQKYGYKGTLSAYEGIRNYLFKKHGIEAFKKGGQKQVKKIMLHFLKENDTKWREGFSPKAYNYNARRIQANFQTFAEWLKNQNQKL